MQELLDDFRKRNQIWNLSNLIEELEQLDTELSKNVNESLETTGPTQPNAVAILKSKLLCSQKVASNLLLTKTAEFITEDSNKYTPYAFKESIQALNSLENYVGIIISCLDDNRNLKETKTRRKESDTFDVKTRRKHLEELFGENFDFLKNCSVLEWESVSYTLHSYAIICGTILQQKSFSYEILKNIYEGFLQLKTDKKLFTKHSQFLFSLCFNIVELITLSLRETKNIEKELENILNTLTRLYEYIQDEYCLYEVSIIKFKIQIIKAHLASTVKAGRKDVKSALEIFNHETKKILEEDTLKTEDLKLVSAFSSSEEKNPDVKETEKKYGALALCFKSNLEHSKQNVRKSVKLLQSATKSGLDEQFFLNNMGCIHYNLAQTNVAGFYFRAACLKSKTIRETVVSQLNYSRAMLHEKGIKNFEVIEECLNNIKDSLYYSPVFWLSVAECSSRKIYSLFEEIQNREKSFVSILKEKIPLEASLKNITSIFYEVTGSISKERKTSRIFKEITSSAEEGLFAVKLCHKLIENILETNLEEITQQSTFFEVWVSSVLTEIYFNVVTENFVVGFRLCCKMFQVLEKIKYSEDEAFKQEFIQNSISSLYLYLSRCLTHLLVVDGGAVQEKLTKKERQRVESEMKKFEEYLSNQQKKEIGEHTQALILLRVYLFLGKEDEAGELIQYLRKLQVCENELNTLEILFFLKSGDEKSLKNALNIPYTV
eukprot:snap_masked-scaffold_43-processed-gene-1.57-mRNA-1 protein AED:0.21 eAED:0.21 QI:0/-1/0/1/-1/1/1/0/717